MKRLGACLLLVAGCDVYYPPAAPIEYVPIQQATLEPDTAPQAVVTGDVAETIVNVNGDNNVVNINVVRGDQQAPPVALAPPPTPLVDSVAPIAPAQDEPIRLLAAPFVASEEGTVFGHPSAFDHPSAFAHDSSFAHPYAGRFSGTGRTGASRATGGSGYIAAAPSRSFTTVHAAIARR